MRIFGGDNRTAGMGCKLLVESRCPVMDRQQVNLFGQRFLEAPWNEHWPRGIDAFSKSDAGKMHLRQRVLVANRPVDDRSVVAVTADGFVGALKCTVDV